VHRKPRSNRKGVEVKELALSYFKREVNVLAHENKQLRESLKKTRERLKKLEVAALPNLPVIRKKDIVQLTDDQNLTRLVLPTSTHEKLRDFLDSVAYLIQDEVTISELITEMIEQNLHHKVEIYEHKHRHNGNKVNHSYSFQPADSSKRVPLKTAIREIVSKN